MIASIALVSNYIIGGHPAFLQATSGIILFQNCLIYAGQTTTKISFNFHFLHFQNLFAIFHLCRFLLNHRRRSFLELGVWI